MRGKAADNSTVVAVAYGLVSVVHASYQRVARGGRAVRRRRRAVLRPVEARWTALAHWYRRSTLRAALAWAESVTRHSLVYRWLTAEPDPDVIVIDLRETRTVGPFIDAMDALVPHLARPWRGSRIRRGLDRGSAAFRDAPVRLTSAFVLGLLLVQFALGRAQLSQGAMAGILFAAAPALLGLRVAWTWDELVESRVGRLARALLVPPEPSEDAHIPGDARGPDEPPTEEPPTDEPPTDESR